MEICSSSSRISMLVVSVSHIAILSNLGHKETRFVSYLIPLLNTFVARAIVSVWNSRQKKGTTMTMAGRMIIFVFMAATTLVTIVSIRASVGNYPGGEALQALHSAVQHENGES